jgi:hypothetical protein
MTQIQKGRDPLGILGNHNEIGLETDGVKWSWACRILPHETYRVDPSQSVEPHVGDIAVVKVEQVGHHAAMMNVNNRKLRLYRGDLIVGVFGNRYATDAVEAEVSGFRDLSLLTSAGMIGTVRSKHQDFGKSTTISFVSFLNGAGGRRVNLKELRSFNPSPESRVDNLIAIVGTGMNCGKTTCVSKLVKQLCDDGLKVGACKLTGSVSNRDQDEMRSAYANATLDFSDYGFPSTYLATREELLSLFKAMMSDLAKSNVDLVVMELADGVLQRETAMLLSEARIKEALKGIVLTADSAPAALYAVDKLKKLGHRIIAVSGRLTSSPLFVKEFQKNSTVEVGSSADTGKELADIVTKFVWPSKVGRTV